MSTPRRISGSPPRPTMRRSAAPRPTSLCVATSRPVSNRPQVAALTNSDGLLPRCDCQLPPLILSRISASRVAASGMRSSASARHIRATPSLRAERELLQQPLDEPGPARLAGPLAHAAGDAQRQPLRRLGKRRGPGAPARSSAGSKVGSARRVAAVIAARSGEASSQGVSALPCAGGGGVFIGVVGTEALAAPRTIQATASCRCACGIIERCKPRPSSATCPGSSPRPCSWSSSTRPSSTRQSRRWRPACTSTPLSLKAVVTSYILSLAVCIPVSGWMADRFGTRRVYASARGALHGRVDPLRRVGERADAGGGARAAGRRRGDDDAGRPAAP